MWTYWCLRHTLTHWRRGCLACHVIRVEFWKWAEGLWVVYIVLAWLMLNAGIVLSR